MKFLYLLIFALCFCACAGTSTLKKEAASAPKNVPVFMNESAKRTALKMTFEHSGKEYGFLLLANKKSDYVNFKFIGDFASVLASVNLKNGKFEYETISPLLENEQIKQALEETLLALFSNKGAPQKESKSAITYKQGNLKYKYYFNKGESNPYKLKQTSPLANKTFLFENYKKDIPHSIVVKAKLNLIKINFELLAND